MPLVLLIGDFHIPHRAYTIPPQFTKLLVPNKMQHVLSTGNLCGRETFDYLKTLTSDIHVVRGDFDDEDSKYPDTKVIRVCNFRIGLCNGHQITPWGDAKAIEHLAKQLDVDIMVTGNTFTCTAETRNHRLFVDPGSVTGAFSVRKDDDVIHSFALLDIQQDVVHTYLYRLINDDVKVDRVVFKKNNMITS